MTKPENCGTGHCSCVECVVDWERNHESAATTYDLAAIKLHGQFAKTNKELGLIV